MEMVLVLELRPPLLLESLVCGELSRKNWSGKSRYFVRLLAYLFVEETRTTTLTIISYVTFLVYCRALSFFPGTGAAGKGPGSLSDDLSGSDLDKLLALSDEDFGELSHVKADI
jgi:hypothetical protein